MAMFLSRLKQILNLGTKSITANGTYSASGDGYDGYSQVSVNMPSVTPSNSTPAALTSGNAVTPNANGYAIERYYNLTPSNNPAIINDDRIYKPSINGFAIHEFYPLTPSDSTPPLLTSGKFYKPSANGYVYATQQPTPTSITPSNSSPVALSANTPVNPTASGYAISSYSSKTPSDSSPASVSSGDIIKANGSGYLYASKPPGFSEQLLWTNPSPTSEFAAQTIVTDYGYFTNYDYIRIIFKSHKDQSNTVGVMFKCPDDTEQLVGGGSYKFGGCMACPGATASNIYARTFTFVDRESIKFSNGTRIGATTTSKNMIIPIYIYGYKFK